MVRRVLLSLCGAILGLACNGPCPSGLERAGEACVAAPGGGDVELGRGTVGPEGGVVRAGPFRLEVPAGALGAQVDLRLSAMDPAGLDEAVLPGSAVRIDPEGTAFARPARLFVRFGEGSTGVVFDPATDSLAHLGEGELANGRYDAGPRELSAEIEHLSPFGVWRISLCNPPRTWCRPRGCVNTANDPMNCGACDIACAPGFSCVGGGCLFLGDAGAPRDAGFDAGVDAGPDAGTDAGPDAGLDAGLDAGPTGPCAMGPAGIATRQELLPPEGENPQVATETLGAVMLGTRRQLARFDAAGALRGAPEPLPAGRPAAVIQAGAAVWELYSSAGSVFVHSIADDGTIGTPLLLGAGARGIEGALAHHAATDTLGALWIDDTAQLVASVVDLAGGTVDHTVIAPEADFLVVPSIVARDAASAFPYTVVYPIEVSLYTYSLHAVSVAPSGAPVALAAVGRPLRTAMHASATSMPGTVVAVWLEDDGVHAARLDAAGAATPLGLLLPEGTALLGRLAVQPSATGFDLLFDRTDAGLRQVVVQSYDPMGTPLGALEVVAPICGPGLGEGRISFVRAPAARHAAWIDLAVGATVFATF